MKLNMEKYVRKMIGFAAILLVLVSCGKDKAQENSNPSIVGTWGFSQVSENGQIYAITAESCINDDTYTFNADGSFKADAGETLCEGELNRIETGTYVVNGNSLQITSDTNSEQIVQDEIPFSLSGNNLVFTDVDGGDQIVITLSRR
jgi:hypothetical protein